jgi:hypothetical protein
MATVELVKHEDAPDCGSFEVRFDDGTPSKWFYWDDVARRRLRTEKVDRRRALQRAQAFARVARVGQRAQESPEPPKEPPKPAKKFRIVR